LIIKLHFQTLARRQLSYSLDKETLNYEWKVILIDKDALPILLISISLDKNHNNYLLTHILYEIQLLSFHLVLMKGLLRDNTFILGGVVAYNYGPENVWTITGMDIGTADHDYSNDVIARAQHLINAHGCQ